MALDSRYAIAARLAQFLRRNGEKVISGSCKLSLTTSALCLLNSLFLDVLNQDWHDLSDITASVRSDISEDVQFLYSFMKKTPSLKLFHGVQTLRGGVDLSHFSSLTVLELRKIPAHLIIGLDCLSIQLKVLICTRSIYLLKEIFGSSLDEQNTTNVWTELKELNLSYNYLENLDDTLKCLPNVEILVLSHNHIKNTEEIQVLKNLSFVNLGYNELCHLPVFNTISCRRMTKLYVRNNNLEDLSGLECLFNLEELDAGYNLLSEYHVLSPLDNLKFLKKLNLEGNPLFFNNRHSVLVATYLHPSILTQGLCLNGKFFTIPENVQTKTDDLNGSNNSAHHHQTSINTVVGDGENMIVEPEECNKSSCEENSISSCTSQTGAELVSVLKNSSEKKLGQKTTNAMKKFKTRVVSICEPETFNEDEIPRLPELTGGDIPGHLKTKQILETRRQERGESWLIPDSSFQKYISSPKVPSNTPVSSAIDIKVSSQEDVMLDLERHFESQNLQASGSPSKCIASTPVEIEAGEFLCSNHDDTTEVLKPDRARHSSKDSDDIEVLASNSKEDYPKTKVPLFVTKRDSAESDFYANTSAVLSESDQEDIINDGESDEETEDSIFFTERRGTLKTQTLSVYIGPKYATEKDVISGKVIDRLDLTSLTSVNATTQEEGDSKKYEVHLEFDTVKTSRQSRTYMFEDSHSSERMSKLLQPFADATTLKTAVIGALQCLKCNSQFSKQVAHFKILKTKNPFLGKDILSSSYDSAKEYHEKAVACPNCGSHIVVEMENMPFPAVAAPSHSAINQIKSLTKMSSKSTDNISVESSSSGSLFSSLFSTIKISPMLKRKSVSGPQNQDPGGVIQASDSINTSMSQSENSRVSESGTYLSRNSSDITVISNPSQSSIAVIPEPVNENNLKTIIESDSHSSVSPVSQKSSILKGANTKKTGNTLESAKSKGPHCTNGDDQDFYSLKNSLNGESDRCVKGSEVMSSGSEVYLSPYKSNSSEKHTSDGSSKSEELDESKQLLHILGEKRMVSHDMFTELDHRLKLHLEISVFGDDEHLEACLQTSIVPLSTGEEIKGVFVLTSKKLYVIKFLPLYSLSNEESQPMEKMIQVLYSGPLNQLKQINVILGSQGLTIACGQSFHVYTLVIRDADICNSFSSLISDFIQEHLPTSNKVDFFSSAEETLQLLHESVFSSHNESSEMPEVLLHLFAFRWNNQNEERDVTHPVCIIITHEDIFMSKILYKKQESCSDLSKTCVYHYADVDHQKIFDLVSLELNENFTSIEVCFLNESSHVENDSISFVFEMQTKSAMFSFISALKNPWEETFGIPLPLLCKQK